jgi:hypothetical protein
MLVQNPLGLLLAALLSSQITRFKALFRTRAVPADGALRSCWSASSGG